MLHVFKSASLLISLRAFLSYTAISHVQRMRY